LRLAILMCGVLGRRLRIAPACFCWPRGALLGFVPTLREVELPPALICGASFVIEGVKAAGEGRSK
jgi:CPA1 family monovalent cation:H+ antiporter